MANTSVVGILRVLLTANAAEFESAMQQAAGALKGWERDLGRFGSKATSLGSSLTKAITVPIAAIGGGAIKAAMDFESSFAGVRKTVDASEAEFAQMAQQFRNLAKEIPVNVNELNRLGEAAGALGIPKGEIVDFVKVMAQLGVTTNLTSDQAADAIARIQNIFGAAGQDTDRFASTLVALGNAGASTEKEIVEMAQRIAGAGHTVGLSQAQVLSFASTLASVGINAEAGGSAISRIFLKMNDAVMDGGGKLAEFARVAGVSAEEFKRAFEADAAQATVLFINGLTRLKSEGENTNATMEGLIGKNIILKDTLNRLAGSGKLLADQLALGNRAWQENTALTKEAEERFKTFESQLKLVWNQIKDVGITIGTALLPVLRDAVTLLQPLIQTSSELAHWFAALPEPARLAALGVAGIAAAAGPAIYFVGQLATATSNLIGLVGAQGLATAASAGAGGLNALKIAALGLGQAFGAIMVVGGSVVLVARALGQASELSRESSERAASAANEQARRYAMMAQASQIAGTSIHDYATAVAIVIEHKRKLADQTGRTALSINEFIGPLQTAGMSAKVVADNAATMSAELAAVHKEIDALTPAQRRAIVDGKALGKSAEEVAKKLGMSEAAVKLFSSGMKQIEKSTKETEKAERDYYNHIGELRMQNEAAFMAYLERQRQLWNDQFKFLAQLRQQSTLQLMSSLDLGKMFEPLKTAPLRFMPTPGAWATAWSGMKSGLSETLKGLPQLFTQAFTGGGGVSGALKGLGVQIANSIAQPLMARISQLAPALQGKIGAALGLGGAGATALGGAFGGSTGATIASVASSLGGLVIATTAWGASMAAAGVAGTVALGATTAGIGAAAVGLYLLGRKWFGVSKDIKEARKAVEEFQDQLAQTLTPELKAQANGEKWKETVLAVQRAYKGVGLTAEEANAIVKQLWDTDHPERAAAAMKTIAAVMEEFGKRVQVAETAFDEIMAVAEKAGGVIPAEMRPMIDQFISLGLLTDDQIARLKGLGEQSGVSLQQMQESIDLFKGRVESLGPAFNQQRIDEISAKYVNALDRLARGGADIGGVLFDAKEELSELAFDSIKHGALLAKNLEPYLRNLFETGQLIDADGNKLEDFSQLKFGEAIKTEAEIMKEAWDGILAKIQELIDKIGQGIPAAVAKVPKNVDITFTPTLSDSENHTMPVPFARGGLVTRPTFAMLGEAGPELVLPLDALRGGLNLAEGLSAIRVPDFHLTTPGQPIGRIDDRGVDDEKLSQRIGEEVARRLEPILEKFTDLLPIMVRDAKLGVV